MDDSFVLLSVGGGDLNVTLRVRPFVALEGAPIFSELCTSGQNFTTYFHWYVYTIYVNK
jgi:hypothetical protein